MKKWKKLLVIYYTQTVVINVTSDDDTCQYDDEFSESLVENGVSLADYPTANPIWILMLILFAGIISTRRFKK
jgi:hypothetical protein